MSTAAAVVVNVGAAAPVHFTAAAHVPVLEPVPSCVRKRASFSFGTTLIGAVNVNVQFAVRVTLCVAPLVQSTVKVAPELPSATAATCPTALALAVVAFVTGSE